MKKIITLCMLAAFAITGCKKQECSAQNQLKQHLQGSYKQVGFKTDLFSSWSYTNAGPEFTISGDSINGIYSTRFDVLNQNTILLQEQNQLVRISFSDTVVFAFQNGDSTKLIRL